jgi:heme o synthase
LLRTYYRLTKPGIIYGNLLSALAGFFLAAKTHPDVVLLIAMALGTGMVIGCACVLNNVIDRGIDRKMARTRKRALVSGEISPLAAIMYAVFLGAAGFTLLLLFTNTVTVLLGAIGLVDYVAVYGYAKRKTPFGTLVGSISGATPLAAGYTAVTGRFDTAALILFLMMVFWQMPHFYAIGLFRRDDYASAGLPIVPVVRSAHVAKVRIVGYVVAYMIASVALFLQGSAGYVYLLGMTALGVWWLWRAVQGFSAPDTTRWARKFFFSSLYVLLGLSVFVGLGAILP